MLTKLFLSLLATSSLIAGYPTEASPRGVMEEEVDSISNQLSKRAPSGPPGFDISNYQPNVDFASAKSKGAKFVIIKATEGTTYKSPSFSKQYTGATNAGLIRGSYHFAHPDSSSGATQANYFLANGGGWSNDGITLPGMLDLESSSGSPTCYGLSKAGLVSWIKDFGSTYKSKTGRYPMIYTNAGWWNQCVASSAFAADYPLVVAHYGSSTAGPLPTGFSTYSFWQWNDASVYAGDSDVWNGDAASLTKFAKGG
ncbi:hypothetical protein IE53DRAFT_247788 [Violaceomyces palustris]|uniref:Uncharacterized protein n=1 Tax=Violaceomyces palustris TaxID=1673888 RepID=A0ACD0NNY8_9BASI|nr:hypothetical protein IE53DRAFT_247788 [Violaceomyces palustris]